MTAMIRCGNSVSIRPISASKGSAKVRYGEFTTSSLGAGRPACRAGSATSRDHCC